MREEVRPCPECLAVTAFYKALQKPTPPSTTCQTCKGRGVVRSRLLTPIRERLKDKPGHEWVNWMPDEWEAINQAIKAARGEL